MAVTKRESASPVMVKAGQILVESVLSRISRGETVHVRRKISPVDNVLAFVQKQESLGRSGRAWFRNFGKFEKQLHRGAITAIPDRWRKATYKEVHRNRADPRFLLATNNDIRVIGGAFVYPGVFVIRPERPLHNIGGNI